MFVSKRNFRHGVQPNELEFVKNKSYKSVPDELRSEFVEVDDPYVPKKKVLKGKKK